MLPDPPSETIDHRNHARILGQSDPDPQGKFRSPTPMTLDDVLSMTLAQLENFQDRVGQLEISNHGLLTWIYGRFPPGRGPFPLVITSRWTSSTFPEPGSLQHRQLVFKQYQKMMEIAHDPTRCVDIVEPATAHGAKALQDYQMQLALLAEHKRARTKRKYQGQDTGPRRPRPLPRFDSGSFKTMQEQCRVMDWDSQPNRRMDHRNDRVIPNITALSEYQQQLLHLEEHNKKRLLMARQEQEKTQLLLLEEQSKKHFLIARQERERTIAALAREKDREAGNQMMKKSEQTDWPSVPIRRRRTNVD